MSVKLFIVIFIESFDTRVGSNSNSKLSIFVVVSNGRVILKIGGSKFVFLTYSIFYIINCWFKDFF